MPVSDTVKKAAALIALTAAVYSPFVLHAGWIWDDDDYVTDNPALTAPGGLRAIWTDPSATPQYYPLTHTTFWVEIRLFGLRPAAFRSVNVGLHGIASVLLALILRRLRVPGAWLAAAIFAVHPLNVESVAWVTERKNVLCGALYLGSMLCWIRAFGLDRAPREAEPRARFPTRAAAAGLALFALALLAKTIAATLPVTIAILLWWKRVPFGRRPLVYLGGMLACGALLGALTAHLERYQIGADGAEWAWTFGDRLRIAGRAWWFYLAKVAWPSNLTFIYPRWDPGAWTAIAWAWPVTAASAVVGLIAAARLLGRAPAAAMLHYSAAIGPALGFVNVYPMRYAFVADHFAYLAVIGPIALASAIVARAAASRWSPVARTAGAGVLVLALAAPAWPRVASFGGTESLWRDTLARNPRAWIAHVHLGILDAERSRLEPAREHFERVLELYPGHPGVRNNLGLVLLRLDRPTEARRILGEAVSRSPDDANAWIHLGDAHHALGDGEAAERAWRRARALRPHDPEPAVREIASLLERGQTERASEAVARALDTFPGNARLHHLDGLTKIAAGHAAEAERALLRAIALDPGSAAAHFHLGNLLAGVGRYGEAIAAYERAIEIEPGHARARRNLDEARRRAGASTPPL